MKSHLSAKESKSSSREKVRSGGIFDYDTKKERLVEVERELELPEIWNEPDRAQALGKERSSLEIVVNTIFDSS